MQYEGGILFINKHVTILARCHVSTPLWFPTADDGNQIKTIENKQLTLLLEDFLAEMSVSNCFFRDYSSKNHLSVILNTLVKEKQNYQCLRAVKCLFTVPHNKISIPVKITRETSLFLFFPTRARTNSIIRMFKHRDSKQIEVDHSLVTGNVWICGHCMIKE